MFKFLKGLVKGSEAPAAAATLSIDELPAWIRGEEEKVREELAGLVATHRPRVSDAVKATKEVLAKIDRVEMEEVSHQKLAGVTEKSLPLFLKAMGMSLSRDLPDDPEGFYTATAEILKGCLSASRGQGKYLSSRFPVEMKTLRHGADLIGREANAMTPGIARARERLRALGELRGALGSYREAGTRVASAAEEARSLEGELAASEASLASVRQALGELGKSTEYRACEGELARIRGLEEERDAVGRRFRGTAATAIHLLGKGEKIASRKRDREAARFLHEALSLLGQELPFPPDVTEGILARGQEALSALAASGDLVPKNREETDILGETGRLATEVRDLSLMFSALSAGIDTAREAVHARPALQRERELLKEAEPLEKRIARARERLDQLRAGGPELQARVQASFRDLEERVTALSGGSDRIAAPGPAPAG
ncbi:MAG TPA: hypothetical protein VMT31_07340 [Methanomicrobiales archaeon]|jgi:DNA repair exonuclease SbcCD ATPase subunit|nr:hypothetical protein [Methanomicrobiales archaeon]